MEVGTAEEILQCREPQRSGDAATIDALEVYIAGRYRTVIDDPALRPPRLSERLRQRLQGAPAIIDRHPNVTAPELRDAESQLEPVLGQLEASLEPERIGPPSGFLFP